MAIKVAQFLDLTVYNADNRRVGRHLYQNYFVGQQKNYAGEVFDFAPFRIEGTSASLNGENSLLQLLFPTDDYVLRALEIGNGNRLSTLKFTSRWLNDNDQFTGNDHSEDYVGIGASFSETTVELRFRSAMDSIGAQFPRKLFSRSLVGILPTNADLVLQ
jgi:hypothetical protein